MKRFLSAFLILFLVAGCARNHGSIDQAGTLSSAEMKLGQEIHQQILQTIPVYPERELNEYVQDLGHKVARRASRRGLDYRFIILDDSRIYATHAPGGYVYVTTGTFSFLTSEIELAGILAYQIASLQYKDPRLSKYKKTYEFLLRSGSYVAPAFGPIGALSVLGLAVIGALTMSEKSDEKQIRNADIKTLQYLSESGYDPQGFIDPLIRMSDPRSESRAYLYDYLQSQPIDDDRLERLRIAFEKLELENRDFDAGREHYLLKTQTVRQQAAGK